jgi:hypothetical protein
VGVAAKCQQASSARPKDDGRPAGQKQNPTSLVKEELLADDGWPAFTCLMISGCQRWWPGCLASRASDGWEGNSCSSVCHWWRYLSGRECALGHIPRTICAVLCAHAHHRSEFDSTLPCSSSIIPEKPRWENTSDFRELLPGWVFFSKLRHGP